MKASLLAFVMALLGLGTGMHIAKDYTPPPPKDVIRVEYGCKCLHLRYDEMATITKYK